MEYYDLINERESVRSYDPLRPVSADVLDRILNAGRLAPSAANLQPWKFLLVSSEEMLEKVRPCYEREWFKKAPHILIIVGLKDRAWVRSLDRYCSLETDIAIAMTHILLAAENEGIGACWIANFNPVILKNALNTGDNETIFCITPLGYYGDEYHKSGVKKRKAFDEVTQFL